MNNDNLASQAISLIRFPLAFGIVLLHSNVEIGEEVLVPRMVWEIFVPFFFAISGYLYFYRIDIFDRKKYLDKTKKRFWSLLLPYIIWNIIAIPFMTLLRSGTLMQQGGVNSILHDLLNSIANPVKVFWGTYEVTNVDIFGNDIYSLWCMDFPLWFVRDLMIICLFTPIIYWFVKKLGIWGMVMLFIPVAMGLRPVVTPRLTSLFYFMFGAFFSINSKNISIKKTYIMGIMGFIAIVFVSIGTYSDTLIVKNICQNLYIVSAMVFLTSAALYIVRKYGHKNAIQRLITWQRYSFFIFAFHSLLPVYGTKAILLPILCSESYPYIINLLGYFVISVIVLIECIVIYHLVSWISPKFNALINGKGSTIFASRK